MKVRTRFSHKAFWSALGSGLNGEVYALAAIETNLYAGGDFTLAGGTSAQHVAQWNGSSWTALDSGMNGNVNALVVSDTGLYAGGDFTRASGTDAYNIAQWDGSSWKPLGSGLNGPVFALATARVSLYAAGRFTMAGGQVSVYLAQANISAEGGRLVHWTYTPANGFGFTFRGATIGQPYCIQACSSLMDGIWTNLTNFSYTGPVVITDPSSAMAPEKFYRAVNY